MWMDEFEICQSYRQAKNRRNMIKTLAELNAVPAENIVAILEHGGEIARPKESKAREPRVRMNASSLPSDFTEIMEAYDSGNMTRKEAAQRCGMTANGFVYWAQRYHDKKLDI